MEPIRVLVVDDEGELAETVAERLSLRGFRAEGVTDGAAALARLAAEPFDAVVLDVQMPGIGGIEVIRRVKQNQPGLAVILVTGHGSRECAEEGVGAGAYRCVMKPVDIEVLAGLVREAVQASAEASR